MKYFITGEADNPDISQAMTEPFVSIVIPAFNADKYIVETLCSVLSQSYSNF